MEYVPLSNEMPHCIACSRRMEYHMPDNRTLIPVCKVCWTDLSIQERAAIVAAFRACDSLEQLNDAIFQGIDGAVSAIVADRLANRRQSGGN
jgi:hypothetical protein